MAETESALPVSDDFRHFPLRYWKRASLQVVLCYLVPTNSGIVQQILLGGMLGE